MDLEIRKMRTEIVNVLNAYPIPIEVKRLVIAEIYNKVSEQADAEISRQLKEKANENNNQSESNSECNISK